MFFRSGYVKEKACGRVGKFTLELSTKVRIAGIVLQAVRTVNRREFGKMASLARDADPNILISGLLPHLSGSVDRVAWQAYQV